MNTINNRTKWIRRVLLFTLAAVLAVCVCLPAVRAAAADKPVASPTDADCPHAEGATKQENYVAPTCVKEGSYDNVTRCAICGKILSTEHVPVKKTDHHIPGPVTIEIVKEPTCADNGSYYEVTRCKYCDKILNKELIRVAKTTNHQPGLPVRENLVPASHMQKGHYDSVIYCEVCGKELERVYREYGGDDYHIADSSLKRTVRRGDDGHMVVTFEDPAYPALTKDAALPSAYEGKTIEAGRYLAGDGSKRTCADGETRCALCGEPLEEAIPHTWDAGSRITEGRWYYGEHGYSFVRPTIRYCCLVCGGEKTVTKIVDLPRRGDVDADGIITTADARLVLRCAVGLGEQDGVIKLSKETITGWQAIADYDADGEITPADARLILRVSVGLKD